MEISSSANDWLNIIYMIAVRNLSVCGFCFVLFFLFFTFPVSKCEKMSQCPPNFDMFYLICIKTKTEKNLWLQKDRFNWKRYRIPLD